MGAFQRGVSGAAHARRAGGPSRHRRPPAGVRAACCLSRWSALPDERPGLAAGGVLGSCLAGGDGMAPSLTPAPCGRGPVRGPGPSRSLRPRRRHPPARARSRAAGGRRRCPVIGCPPFPVVTGATRNHCVLINARYVTDCGGPRCLAGTGAALRKSTVRIDVPGRDRPGRLPVLAGRGGTADALVRSVSIVPGPSGHGGDGARVRLGAGAGTARPGTTECRAVPL